MVEDAQEPRRSRGTFGGPDGGKDVGRKGTLRPVPADRYDSFDVVGQGGMGIVYLALDTDLNREVAFKIVRPPEVPVEHTPATPLGLPHPQGNTPGSAAFEALRARFLQEAWVTAGLEHPGIVPVYEVGQTPTGVPYFTMRYVRGRRTLAQAMDEVRTKGSEDRLGLLEQFLKLCDAVAYAHDKGVIHRDLKPQNVALGDFGEVVLLDWGLARVRGGSDGAASPWQARLHQLRRATDLETLGGLGTPGYMAPEAVLGAASDVDERSDVYSLGTMLFEILTGRLPFSFQTYGEYVTRLRGEVAPKASSLDPAVPDALDQLCARALERRKERRLGSVKQLAARVRAWLRDNAMERETQQAVLQARAALEAAAELRGDDKLRHVERASAALARVEARRPTAPELIDLQREADRLRALALSERDRARSRRLLTQVGVAGMVLISASAFIVAGVLDRMRRKAERAEEDTARALGRETEAKHATERALATAEEASSKLASALGRERAAREAADLARQETARALATAEEASSRIASALGHERAAREAADRARQETATALDEAEVHAYFSTLGAARESLDAGEARRAQALLAGVKPARRGPECAHLELLADSALTSLKVPGGAIHSLDISPEGLRVLAVGGDRTVHVYDLQGDTLRHRFSSELPSGVDGSSVSFGASGDALLALGASEPTSPPGAAKGPAGEAGEGSGPPVYMLRLDPASGAWGRRTQAWGRNDARSLAARRMDARARIGNLVTLKDAIRVWADPVLAALGSAQATAQTCADAHGARSAAGDSEGTIAVREDAARRELGGIRWLPAHSGAVADLAFDAEGRLFSVGRDGTLRSHDIESGHSDLLMAVPGRLTRLALSADLRWIATASEDGRIHVWDRTLLRPLGELFGHDGAVNALAFVGDSRRLLSAGRDGTVRLWDLAASLAVQTVQLPMRRVEICAISPDGSHGVSLFSDAFLIHDLRSGMPVHLHRGAPLGIEAVAISREANVAMVAGHEVHSWHAGKAEAANLGRAPRKPLCVDWWGDPAVPVTGHEGGVLTVWARSTAWEATVSEAAIVQVAAVASTGSESQTLFAADADGAVFRVTRTRDDLVVTRVLAPGSEVLRVAVNGERVAVARRDGSLQVGAADSSIQVCRPGSLEGLVTGLAWSSDGQRLLLATDSGAVMVFRSDGESPGFALANLQARLVAIACAADRPTLTCVDQAGTVRVFLLGKQPGQLRALREAHQRRTAAQALADSELADEVQDGAREAPGSGSEDTEVAAAARILVALREPEVLAQRAWMLIRKRDHPPSRYQRALGWSTAIAAQRPEEPAFAMLVGAALFRLGRYEEARSRLLAADAQVTARGGTSGATVVFLYLATAALEGAGSATALHLLERAREIALPVYLSFELTAGQL